jgi:chromosome segregation ATPase
LTEILAEQTVKVELEKVAQRTETADLRRQVKSLQDIVCQLREVLASEKRTIYELRNQVVSQRKTIDAYEVALNDALDQLGGLR